MRDNALQVFIWYNPLSLTTGVLVIPLGFSGFLIMPEVFYGRRYGDGLKKKFYSFITV